MALVLVQPARAHVGEGDWINQDRYKSPSAAGLYIGTHCCGSDDVHKIIEGVDFRAEGDHYVFLDGPAAEWGRKTWNFDITGKTWPRDPRQVYDSEDVHSWVSLGNLGVRCLFISAGGF